MLTQENIDQIKSELQSLHRRTNLEHAESVNFDLLHQISMIRKEIDSLGIYLTFDADLSAKTRIESINTKLLGLGIQTLIDLH